LFSTAFHVNYHWVNALHLLLYGFLYLYRFFAIGDLLIGVGIFLAFPSLQTMFNFLALTGLYIYLQPEDMEKTFFAPVFLILALIRFGAGLVF